MGKNKIYPILSNMLHPYISPGPRFPGVEGFYADNPVICYLVETEDDWILVDTGASDEVHSEKYHYKMTPLEDNHWDKLLEPFELSPADIKVVVNTHLHWDHCYNNDLFPDAEIYVQKKELQFAVTPIPSQYIFYEAFQIGMTPPWLKAANQFVILDGEESIADGVTLVPLPGHCPGFQGVLVETEAGRYLIAGDCVPNMAGWNNKLYGFPVPSDIHVDLEEYYETLKKMMAMNAAILPGHDMSVFKERVYPPKEKRRI